jgi:uncharacterized protein YtpQ (UPF0354 family)
VLTIAQIHAGIARELKFLEESADNMALIGDQAAETEATYKVELAKARLSIRALSKEKLTVDEVGDRALDLVEELYRNYLVCQNRMTTARESLRASQSRLDGYRSLLVSVRAGGG